MLKVSLATKGAILVVVNGKRKIIENIKRLWRHGKLLQTAAKYFIFNFRAFFATLALQFYLFFQGISCAAKAQTLTYMCVTCDVCVYVCDSKRGLTHRHCHGQHECECYHNNNYNNYNKQWANNNCLRLYAPIQRPSACEGPWIAALASSIVDNATSICLVLDENLRLQRKSVENGKHSTEKETKKKTKHALTLRGSRKK